MPIRLTILISLIGVVAGGMTGCGPWSPSGRETFSHSEYPITLGFWYAVPLPDQSLFFDLVEQYNRSRKEIRIIPQVISAASLVRDFRAAVMAGYGPQIVLLHNHTIGDLVVDNLLLPLDTLTSLGDRNQLLPTAVGGGVVYDLNGIPHLYGLPMMFDTLALYYRKDLVSEPPTDIESLLSIAHRLTTPFTADSPSRPLTPTPSRSPSADSSAAPAPAASSRMWGLAYTLSLDKTIGYLYAHGGYVFDNDGQLALGQAGREGTERWLHWLQSLQQDPLILAGRDDILIDNAIKAQQVAMVIDWAHALPTYQDLWGDQLGVTMLPTVQKQSPRPYVQSWLLCINAHTNSAAEQKAALDFISYLLSSESQKRLLASGKQPALLNLGAEGGTSIPGQVAPVFRAQAWRGQPMPNSPTLQDGIRNELERMIVMVLRGLATPSEAITYADTALRERLYSSTGFPHLLPLPTVRTEASQLP